MALAHAAVTLATARRIAPGGFVTTGSNRRNGWSRLLPVRDCSATRENRAAPISVPCRRCRSGLAAHSTASHQTAINTSTAKRTTTSNIVNILDRTRCRIHIGRRMFAWLNLTRVLTGDPIFDVTAQRNKPSGPYFGAVPPLPVVVAGVVVAGVLPRRTSRRS